MTERQMRKPAKVFQTNIEADRSEVGEAKAEVRWNEAACLVRRLSSGDREVALEATFERVALTLARYAPSVWSELTISFPERHIPPFRYEAKDFSKLVVGRLIGKSGFVSDFSQPNVPRKTPASGV